MDIDIVHKYSVIMITDNIKYVRETIYLLQSCSHVVGKQTT